MAKPSSSIKKAPHAPEPRDALVFELGERALDIELLGAGDQHGISRDP